MLSVAEAHERVLNLFAPLGHEAVPLAAAGGRVLAEDVIATRDQPPFSASAMDGYAARSADARPGACLRVVGEVPAGGHFPGTIGAGEAVRIFTGAPVPAGADIIVIQEDVARSGNEISLSAAFKPRDHIRPAGGDFTAGMRLSAPRRLSPGDLGLLAAMNASRLRVARRPVVALISTGDELVMPGETPRPDQIVSSNGIGIKALIEAHGAEARLLPIARDTADSLMSVFDLCAGCDAIVSLGGASVGDYDLVQSTAEARGLALDFYKVAMRPGKPLIAGRMDGVPLLGLPGNPVSAQVCAILYLRPAIDVMLGLPAGLPSTQSAPLARDLPANGPRQHYMRAVCESGPDGMSCTPFANQDSSLLSVLARANALIVRPPNDPARRIGESVEFFWI